MNLNNVEECSECGEPGTIFGQDVCPTCLQNEVAKDVELKLAGYMAGDDGFDKTLSVVLTEHEVMSYGQEQSRLILDKGQLDVQKSTITKKIKPMVERIEELAPIIDEGTEERPVLCKWVFQWEKKRKVVVRQDTGEIVGVEKIRPEETQQHLDLQEKTEQPEQVEPCEDHDFEAFSVSIDDGLILVRCVDCGVTGAVGDHSEEEFDAAVNAEDPYIWGDSDRVVLDKVVEAEEQAQSEMDLTESPEGDTQEDATAANDEDWPGNAGEPEDNSEQG